MTNLQESRFKIAEASRGCEDVIELLNAAIAGLRAGRSSNPYGILHNRGDHVRDAIATGKRYADEALAKLDAINFPTASDYDAL